MTKVIRIFHYLSHARWIFMAWAVYLMIQAFLDPRRYALTNTGLAVFLAGLFLGFFGFSDIERLSKREKKEFAKPKKLRISSIFLLAWSGLIFAYGVFFMNIKWFRPATDVHMALEFKTIGFHMFALGFGFLCYLKLLFDKYKYYLSLPEDERS